MILGDFDNLYFVFGLSEKMRNGGSIYRKMRGGRIFFYGMGF